jgi:hypothetical protein
VSAAPFHVAQRVSEATHVCAHHIKDLGVAYGCRAAAGLPSPAPLDARRVMVSWERMVQREQEPRTRGCVAWSLAVCAADRAKPVMDACLYNIYVVIYAACRDGDCPITVTQAPYGADAPMRRHRSEARWR